MRNYSFFLVLFLSGLYSFGQDQCSAWIEKADLINSSKIDFEPDKAADVILLGEHHLHNVDSFLNYFLAQHSPEYNCLFLEMDRNSTSLPPRFEAFRQTATSLNINTHLIDFKLAYPEWVQYYLSNRDELFQQNPEAYALAQARVYEWIVDQSEGRNEAMSKEMQRLLSDGSCDKGIALLGSFHIYNEDPEKGLTIPEFLKDLGISYRTYLLEETLTFLTGTGLGGPQNHLQVMDYSNQYFKLCEAGVSSGVKRTLLDTNFTIRDILSTYNGSAKLYDGYFFIPQY